MHSVKKQYVQIYAYIERKLKEFLWIWNHFLEFSSLTLDMVSRELTFINLDKYER